MTERNEKAMGSFEIRVPRTYEASVERVFDAWRRRERRSLQLLE